MVGGGSCSCYYVQELLALPTIAGDDKTGLKEIYDTTQASVLTEVGRYSAKPVGSYSSSPQPTELLVGYPNPFNRQANIKFRLARGGKVSVDSRTAVTNLVSSVYSRWRAHGRVGARRRRWRSHQ
jgi:hypothetical protein